MTKYTATPAQAKAGDKYQGVTGEVFTAAAFFALDANGKIQQLSSAAEALKAADYGYCVTVKNLEQGTHTPLCECLFGVD